MNATNCIACGENAGKGADGNIRRYCKGFIGPLETYMCRCECHSARRGTNPKASAE